MRALPRSLVATLTALALSAAGLLAPDARADVIMPGTHAVNHEIVFEKDDEVRGYDFCIFPTYMSGGYAKIVMGKPVSFYKFMSPQVFAIPTGTADMPEDPEAQPASGTARIVLDKEYFERKDVPRSDLHLEMRPTASDGDPTTAIRTVYRIMKVAKGKVELKLISDERFDKMGKKIASAGGAETRQQVVLGALAFAGILGVAASRRKKAAG